MINLIKNIFTPKLSFDYYVDEWYTNSMSIDQVHNLNIGYKLKFSNTNVESSFYFFHFFPNSYENFKEFIKKKSDILIIDLKDGNKYVFTNKSDKIELKIYHKNKMRKYKSNMNDIVILLTKLTQLSDEVYNILKKLNCIEFNENLENYIKKYKKLLENYNEK